MGNWKQVKIGDICKTNAQAYSVSENWPFVNYLDTGNITENRIEGFQRIELVNSSLPSRARRKVAVNDIIYSTVRPNQRHYGIIKKMLPNMLVSTGFTVITVDTKFADADFLYYFLTQNDIVNSLHAIGEQSVSAYPSIKSKDIENLEIMLPPLKIQKEIGRTLQALDHKITNNTRINHHLPSPRSATDSSPDIRRGKSVSRSSARRTFSLQLLSIVSKIGCILSSNAFISFVAGAGTNSFSKSRVTMASKTAPFALRFNFSTTVSAR